MKKLPENLKQLRISIQKETKSLLKGLPISCHFNHYREGGCCFVFGVDYTLSDEKRTEIWLTEGLRVVSHLEKLGYKIDREMFATNKDGRSFFAQVA